MFFGTPRWAVPSLDALIESDIDVLAVVTNPDRPAGRGMEVAASPIKESAAAAGIKVLQPASARGEELHTALEELNPDVAVVVAYGKILPAAILAVPRLGFVNVHFSLLPAYRGAAPVQRALMDGVTTTGVSIIVLTEGMDEGPILATEAIEVGSDETARMVGDRLSVIGARLLITALKGYANGDLVPIPQDHDAATYAPKIDTAESRIDWNAPTTRVHNLVRALNPAPGAWTTLRGARVKIFRTRPVGAHLEPGRLEAGVRLLAGTGDGALELTEVQAAGKRRMSGSELARGLRLEPGERFE